MSLQSEFADILKTDEPLAPLTHLRLGGPAQYLLEPQTREELASVVRRCYAESVPFRVLGSGVNLLVPDEGITGVVIRLSGAEFTAVSVDDTRAVAGSGAPLYSVIAETCRRNLAGLETLAGISGTVGGALRCNAGDGATTISDYVLSVDVMDEDGNVFTRQREEIRFSEHASDLDDPVILSIAFALVPEEPHAIVKRMRKAWIQRKARLPHSYENAVRAFRDPPGVSAAELIEDAGLGRAQVGKAEVSDRNANYVIARDGATSRDLLELLEHLERQGVERTGTHLERESTIW